MTNASTQKRHCLHVIKRNKTTGEAMDQQQQHQLVVADRDEDNPLLMKPSSTTGTASPAQTFGNILVSILGTGILGLPFAFRVSGWLAGSIAVITAAIATYYCMLILVSCKNKLVSEGCPAETLTYGGLGDRCIGKTGRYLTESLILICGSGGAVAYLLFIAQNLSNIFASFNLTQTFYLFILIPIEIPLSWIRSLSSLAPLTTLANVCNIAAILLVLKDEVQRMIKNGFDHSIDNTVAVRGLGSVPFALGTAVYCFDGFAMTLPLEASIKDKKLFSGVLGKGLLGIMVMYGVFGTFGYVAYGDQTSDIVTLNLASDWSATAVQVGLCLGIIFTFPVVLHPMHEVLEGILLTHHSDHEPCPHYHQPRAASTSRKGAWRSLVIAYAGRAIFVVLMAILALYVPTFGVFVSVVGSTVSGLLSFVLPTTFHLLLFGSSLRLWQRMLDLFISFFGLAFACYGIYTTIFGVPYMID